MRSLRIGHQEARNMHIVPVRSNLLLRERRKAMEDAARLIQQAEDRAREILERAEQEAESARKDGREEGRIRAEREVASRIAQAARLRDLAAESLVPRLAGLAAKMASRILHRELRQCPESVVGICREVLRENRPGQRLVVEVNPRDLEMLRRHRPELAADSQATVEFIASGRVEPGGCLVRGELGQVDARLSTQLAELERALAGG